MSPTAARNAGPKGLTLIEVLIGIVIVAFLGLLVVNFMGRKVTHSFLPLSWVTREAGLERQMESVVSDYVREMNTSATPATVLETIRTRNVSGQYGSGVSMYYVTFSGFAEANSSGAFPYTATDYLHVSVSDGNQTLMTVMTRSRSGTADLAINF